MIHTHPIKTDAEIEKAVAAGVTTFVVDNVDELVEIDSLSALDSSDVAIVFYRTRCPD